MANEVAQSTPQTAVPSPLFLAIDDRATDFIQIQRAFDSGSWGRAEAGAPQNAVSRVAQPPSSAITRISLTDESVVAEAQQTLAREPDARLIFIYQNPAVFLAAQVKPDAGGSPLQVWCDATQQLLENFRKHRRQSILIDGHAAISAPAALAEQVSARLGYVLDLSKLTDAQDSTDVDAVMLALADAAMRHDDAANRLLTELEASSLPLPPPYSDTKANVLDAWRQSGEAEDQKAKLQELERESDLLLVQLHQVQEELEHYYFVNKDLEEKLQQAQTLSTQREEALHQAQTLAIQREEALTRTQAELARKRKALAAKRKELERKKRQVQDIYRSTSWKLAGPLRKLRRLFSRRARG